MGANNCTIMELYCLHRAKSEPLNRGKWIAQAERWHDLSRARDSWRFQKSQLPQPMLPEPTSTQSQQSYS
jgi:hypothetical protein